MYSNNNIQKKDFMKDILLDVVKHINNIGGFEHARITGTSESTELEALDVDKSCILKGTFNEVVPEFEGTIGLGNIGFLHSILNLHDYQEEAKISVMTSERNGETTPSGLTFENNSGSVDRYRFMSKEILDQTMKKVDFKGAKWNVTIEPTKIGVGQFASFASAYSSTKQEIFTIITENNNLVFQLGSFDGNNNGGKRIFARNVDGELTQNWSWKITPVLEALKLGMSGTCVMKVSDQGVLQITVDSGIGTYNYLFKSFINKLDHLTIKEIMAAKKIRLVDDLDIKKDSDVEIPSANPNVNQSDIEEVKKLLHAIDWKLWEMYGIAKKFQEYFEIK